MPRSTTFVLKVSVPANAPAYKPIAMKITPAESGVQYDEYMAERLFVIEDAFIRADADAEIDGFLRVVKNRERIMTVSTNVKGLVVTNPAKPHAFGGLRLGFRKGDILTVEFIPDSSPTSAKNVTVFLRVTLAEA
jgi:transcriptional accessory protein Tex/SPT6